MKPINSDHLAAALDALITGACRVDMTSDYVIALEAAACHRNKTIVWGEEMVLFGHTVTFTKIDSEDESLLVVHRCKH